jgi:hypothetical protein
MLAQANALWAARWSARAIASALGITVEDLERLLSPGRNEIADRTYP